MAERGCRDRWPQRSPSPETARQATIPGCRARCARPAVTQQRNRPPPRPPQPPPVRQGHGQAQRRVQVVLQGPGQGLMRWWRPRHPATGPRPAPRRWSAWRLRPALPPAAHTGPAPAAAWRRSPALGEPREPVGAQGLQHQVPGPAVRARSGAGLSSEQSTRCKHHRLGTGPRDRLRGLQGERAGEDREAAEHLLLLLAEQPVTPLHGRGQRPMPRRRLPGPGRPAARTGHRSGPAAAPRPATPPGRRPAQSPAASHPAAPPAAPPPPPPRRSGRSAGRPGGPGRRTTPPPPMRRPPPGDPARARPAAAAGSGPPRPDRAARGWSPAPAHHRAAGSSVPHSSATASSRCSQLSSTSSSWRRASTPVSASTREMPGG